MKILISGGAGFFGANFVRYIIDNTDWEVVVIDRLSYAGRLDRLKDLPQDRLEIIHHDISKPFDNLLLSKLDVDYVAHAAAESHAAKSCVDTKPFIDANVIGTLNILEAARIIKPKKFIYVSTDETVVEGDENSACNPSNVYAATKACGEFIANCYRRSFNVPVIITRSSNMYGMMQDTEKFIPMTIKKCLTFKVITIHESYNEEIGTRQWLHVDDQSNALLFLLENGVVGETYHVAGEKYSNFDVAEFISDTVGRQEFVYDLVNPFEQYPAHDLHYNISDNKIRSMGWEPKMNFYEELSKIVNWSVENKEWLI
jgi:dTDP-glucose 4,6-dehydratase